MRPRILSGGIALSGILLSAGCAGSPTLDREDVCTEQDCRPARTVRLFNQSAELADFRLPRAPWIVDGVVSLPSGETIALRTQRRGGKILPDSAIPLREGASPEEGAILLSLRQEPADSSGRRMTLRIHNPFDGYLQLFANMQPATEKRFFPMPTCTIPPARTGVQQWRYPTIQVTLWRFRITKTPPSADVCRTTVREADAIDRNSG